MEEHNTSPYFSEQPALPTPSPVRVRHVLAILFLLCLAGIFLILVITKIFETGLGWSIEILAGQLSESSPDADVWKVRLLAGINQFFVFMVPALCTIYILRRSAPYIKAQVSLRRFPDMVSVGWAIALLIASMPLVFYSSQINKLLSIPEELAAAAEQAETAIKALMRMPDIWALLANLGLIAVLPALGEELLFRGLVQNQLMRRMAPLGAIVLSGAIFSLLHFQMDGFLPRWILGIVLGWAYWRTGNFWIPVLLHFLNNGVQVVAQFLYGQQVTSIDLTENDVEVPWVAAVFSVVAMYFVVGAMQRHSIPEKNME
jgi:uncharacterized protein